jgi:hypothetical protein
MGQIRDETRGPALCCFFPHPACLNFLPARRTVRYHLPMKLALAGFLLACLLPAFSQPAPKSAALSPEEQNALVRLGGQIMIAGQAYDYDRHLADDIGPRLTGSENYVKAAAWAESEFTLLGLANVHRESWEIPATWEPETLATARILKPHEQRLHLESEGWSPSTPESGVHGTIFYLKVVNPDAVKSSAPQIKDTIVLIDEESVFAEKPFRFGRLFDALRMIGEEGARGIIFGLGATNNAPSLIGNTGFTGTPADVPNEGQYTFETDEAPFLVQGVPSFVLWTPTEKYDLLHHKPSDTFDKVDQRDLNLGVAVVGITAYAFADAPTTLPHLDATAVENEFKNLKVMEQYQDLQDHKMF